MTLLQAFLEALKIVGIVILSIIILSISYANGYKDAKDKYKRNKK